VKRLGVIGAGQMVSEQTCDVASEMSAPGLTSQSRAWESHL
jgi:hypothetical protein